MHIKQEPSINVKFCENFIEKYSEPLINVAISVEGGAFIPTINHADTMQVGGISEKIKSFKSRAESGDLGIDECGLGALTISNLGMYGINRFTSIIPKGTTCILAIGTAMKKPVLIDEKVGISLVAEFTMSADHRVLDGANVALWLNKFKTIIENPFMML